MNPLIHWQEGMFVRPHHFQLMQHGLLQRVQAAATRGLHYPYGVVEAQLSRDALESGEVRFDRLHVVLRNGWEVRVPDDCDLPVLGVRDALRQSRTGEVEILLGLPRHDPRRGNAARSEEVGDPRLRLVYRQRQEQRIDENTGDNPQPVPFRLLNARLLIAPGSPEAPELADLETLTVAAIRRAATDGAAIRAEPVIDHAPPCLYLAASPGLGDLVRTMHGRIENSRRAIARRLAAEKFAVDNLHGSQFAQLLRLRALSRGSVRAADRLNAPQVTPAELFLELHGVLAELEAFTPSAARSDSRALVYDHDKPYRAFSRLSERLNLALQEAEELSYEKVEFDRAEQRFARAALLPEHFGSSVTGYFLGITHAMDSLTLARRIEDPAQFELTSGGRVGRNFGGIPLKWQEAPAGLPSKPNLHYFQIRHREPSFAALWDAIRREGTMAVTRRKENLDLSEAEFTLYLTLAPRTYDEDAA